MCKLCFKLFALLLCCTSRQLRHYPPDIYACASWFSIPPSVQSLNQKTQKTHISSQDIFTLFHLNRSFKFVSKTSNFLIPIIGWSMFLTGTSVQKQRTRSPLHCTNIAFIGSYVYVLLAHQRSQNYSCGHPK